jgi:sphingolipid C9-methyltransferase
VSCFDLAQLHTLANTLFEGDVLDIMEQRHDWAKMTFTPELFKYVLTEFLPEVIVHSKSQDEEQVRDHYDRELNNVYIWPASDHYLFRR